MQKRRRVRRLLTVVVPIGVWLSAIAAAVHLHRQLGSTGAATGFADRQPVTLAHPETGVIRGVHVGLYDHVTRGQILVSLDDHKERIELAAVEEHIERLRAEVVAEQARLVADNGRATADVEDLARRFAVDRDAAHIDYLAQVAINARDRMLLRGAAVEYEIAQDLHDEEHAAFRELNEMRTRVESLEANLTESTALLDRLKQAFVEADRRRFAFEERRKVDALLEPVLAPLRLSIDVRQRSIDEIVRRIDAHVLRAPIDGQVTAMLAHAGDHVQGGDLLVTVSPTAADRVIAYLPEHMILSAGVGARALVNCTPGTDGARRAYPGTVVSLSETVDEAPPRHRQAPTYPVWGRGFVVALDSGITLIPGEAVTVALLERD